MKITQVLDNMEKVKSEKEKIKQAKAWVSSVNKYLSQKKWNCKYEFVQLTKKGGEYKLKKNGKTRQYKKTGFLVLKTGKYNGKSFRKYQNIGRY